MSSRQPQQRRALRQALILQGIDLNRGRALVGTCHTDAVVAETLAGFAAAVRAVQNNGLLQAMTFHRTHSLLKDRLSPFGKRSGSH